MKTALSGSDLATLINSVFNPGKGDSVLALFTDIPESEKSDNKLWFDRRKIVYEWYEQFKNISGMIGIEEIRLYLYENVGSNNADLPEVFYRVHNPIEPVSMATIEEIGIECSRDAILSELHIIIAPTELSATAPLKILGRQFPFRAATMPGFSRKMIPALGLNYEDVHRRVMVLKKRLDRAQGAKIIFSFPSTQEELFLDLRYRTAHASTGLLREKGLAANLPSGETYIVPYEGEREGDPSRSKGVLPVNIDGELVLFQVEKNRAIGAEGRNEIARREHLKIKEEPAYGNIAELGLGILGEFGIKGVGSVLLDEKLGLHVALGRSEHFGGITGPASFTSPKKVIHHDFVYVPSLQPDILIEIAELQYENGENEVIMRKNKYLV